MLAFGQLAAIVLHLHTRAVDGHKAALVGVTFVFKAQLGKGLTNLYLTQRLRNVTTNHLQRHRGRDQLSGFIADRLTEVQINKVEFGVLRLKLLVMLVQLYDFVPVEPVAEALLIESVGLCEDGIVVEGC